MLRWVLWLAVACAVILAALAISRGVDFSSDPEPRPKALTVEEAAEPEAAAPERAPAAPVAPLQPTDEDLQVQEDAAATGMTTFEPDPEVGTESAPPPQTPPS